MWYEGELGIANNVTSIDMKLAEGSHLISPGKREKNDSPLVSHALLSLTGMGT